ncbi:13115_t:CDS:1, partial [Funneliformis geosporum]
MEQTYSDTSAGDKIEVYEFLEALGLLDNEVSPVNMDDDDNNESDIDEED